MKKTRTIFSISLVATFLVWGLFAGLVLRTEAGNRSLALRTAELEAEVRKEAHARSLQTLVESTRSEREQLGARILPADGVVAFIKQVEGLRRYTNSSLSINSVDFAQVREGEAPLDTELLRVSLSAVGTWQELMLLVALVDSLPVRVDIDRTSFALVEAGAARSAPQWQGTLEFTVVKERAKE
jgi:hypothetical protein